MTDNVKPLSIPAKRYFSLEEACTLAGVNPEQVVEWQKQNGIILGKGARVLTRLDVIKLHQLSHGISNYFARDALDKHGNPVISATEMKQRLKEILARIDMVLDVVGKS